jgi:hypothetical protein
MIADQRNRFLPAPVASAAALRRAMTGTSIQKRRTTADQYQIQAVVVSIVSRVFWREVFGNNAAKHALGIGTRRRHEAAAAVRVRSSTMIIPAHSCAAE